MYRWLQGTPEIKAVDLVQSAWGFLSYTLFAPVRINVDGKNAQVMPFGLVQDPNNPLQGGKCYQVTSNQTFLGISASTFLQPHDEMTIKKPLFPGSPDSVDINVPLRPAYDVCPALPFAGSNVNCRGQTLHPQTFAHGAMKARDVMVVEKPIGASAGNVTGSAELCPTGNLSTQAVPENLRLPVATDVAAKYQALSEGPGRTVMENLSQTWWKDECTLFKFSNNDTTLMQNLNHVLGRDNVKSLLEKTGFNLIPKDMMHRDQRHNHLCHLLAQIELCEFKPCMGIEGGSVFF